MATKTTSKRKRNVISDDDRSTLRRARTTARGEAEWTKVPAHKRKQYRLKGYASKLSSWDRAEEAVFALCSMIDRCEKVGMPKDREDDSRMRRLTQLLEDTLAR